MLNFLDFEKPIAELEARATELRETAEKGSLDLDAEIGKIEAKIGLALVSIRAMTGKTSVG